MNHPNIDELRRQYTGKHVTVDPARPELARWAGVVGQVKTINQNGRALVQFADADEGWHDFDLDTLHLAASPEAGKPAGAS